jgi:hypothetical protein
LHERARHRRLRVRAGVRLDLLADRLLYAIVLATRDAGQHPLQHNLAQAVAVGEMVVPLQRHLGLAIGGQNPRPLDPNAPTSERHLTVLVAMTDRCAIRIPLPLRTDDLLDLLLQQLLQNTEPNLDRQGQQPLLRCPHQLPQCLLHAPREHGLIDDRLGDRTLHVTAVPPLDLGGLAHHAPTRSGRAGGTAVTSKFYERRDNLRGPPLRRQRERLLVRSRYALGAAAG